MVKNPVWILQRIGNSREEFAYVFKEGLYRVKVGRDINCQVVCKGDIVSRNHCELLIEKDKIFIMDLGSRNGTFVNNSLILKEDAVPLENGSIISFGRPYLGGEIPLDQIVYKVTACKVVEAQMSDVIDEKKGYITDEISVDLKMGFIGFENDPLFKYKIQLKLDNIYNYSIARKKKNQFQVN